MSAYERPGASDGLLSLLTGLAAGVMIGAVVGHAIAMQTEKSEKSERVAQAVLDAERSCIGMCMSYIENGGCDVVP
jgi:hypothetical protein